MDPIPSDALSALKSEISSLYEQYNSSAVLHSKLALLRQNIATNATAKEVYMDKSLFKVLNRIYSQTAEQAQRSEASVSSCLALLEKVLAALPPDRKKRKSSITGPEALHSAEVNIGDEVAARVSPAAKRGGVAQYILAKVTKIVPVANNKLKYEVVDEEPGDEQEGAGLAAPQKKTYTLPRESIILLKNIYGEFPKGATVLAMYPHTTTFYPATVITPATKKNPWYSLEFSEDNNQTQKVQARYVVPLPME